MECFCVSDFQNTHVEEVEPEFEFLFYQWRNGDSEDKILLTETETGLKSQVF